MNIQRLPISEQANVFLALLPTTRTYDTNPGSGIRGFPKERCLGDKCRLTSDLMTTTGRTRLEVVAAKSSLGGHENVSKELQDMEVRFGELIHVDEAADGKEVSGEYAQAAHLDDHVTETTFSTEDDIIQQIVLNLVTGYVNIASNPGATVK
jgi:hypothetical protein